MRDSNVGLTYVDEKKSCPLGWNEDKYQRLDCAKKYNNAIKAVCQEKRVTFIDILDLLDENDLYDGVHPNAEGHRKTFEEVKSFFI